MKSIIIGMILLVGLAAAAGYNDWQQGAVQGLKIGFHMGQAYNDALKGINVTGFNSEVDIYNAWVRQNFGEDVNLMMQKMAGPVDLSKPYLSVNNSNSNRIVHAIDGSQNMSGPTYTTNDMNLLPESVTQSMYNDLKADPTNQKAQGDFLGGI
jgi:hypothetical protein